MVDAERRVVDHDAVGLAGFERDGVLVYRVGNRVSVRYAKIRDGMQEKQQQSKVARRRGGRRRDDLNDSAYKMPQIVIEQEPASLRRVG